MGAIRPVSINPNVRYRGSAAQPPNDQLGSKPVIGQTDWYYVATDTTTYERRSPDSPTILGRLCERFYPKETTLSK